MKNERVQVCGCFHLYPLRSAAHSSLLTSPWRSLLLIRHHSRYEERCRPFSFHDEDSCITIPRQEAGSCESWTVVCPCRIHIWTLLGVSLLLAAFSTKEKKVNVIELVLNKDDEIMCKVRMSTVMRKKTIIKLSCLQQKLHSERLVVFLKLFSFLF